MSRLSPAPREPDSQPAAAPTQEERLQRENVYLRQRNAQLQDDVVAVTADADRLRQVVDRLHGRTALRTPNPLGGGQ